MKKFGVDDVFTPENPVFSTHGAVVTNIAHIPAALTAVMRENGARPDFATEGSLALKPWFGSNQGLDLPPQIDIPARRTSSPSRVNPTLMTFRSRGSQLGLARHRRRRGCKRQTAVLAEIKKYCIARRPLPTLLGHSAFAVARVFLVARHWLAEVRRNRCLSSSPKSPFSTGLSIRWRRRRRLLKAN